MSKQITAKQLRMFAKEVGIKSISGYTKTKAIKAIISKTDMTSQYTIAFMDWYKQLDDALFDKKGKMLKPHIDDAVPGKYKLKVFSIETYSNCTITEENHQRKFICTFPKGDLFEFSIDINRSSFKPEFQCIYKDKHGRGVLLYRSEPNEHIRKFWTQLGNQFFQQENGYRDAMRDRVLNEFDFNWEGDE
jgi:hypothetical protein